MSVITGKGGFVVGKNCVLNWSISHVKDLQPYVCSATEGMTARVDGNNDWNGTYKANGALPDVLPGAGFTFEGVISGTRGASGNVGASGPAIVDQVEIVFDYEAGAIVQHTVSFSSNGALSFSTIDSSGDSETLGVPLTSVGLKPEFFDIASTPAKDSDLDLNWRTCTLTITSANAAFVDTSIAGETQRAAGNLDCTLAMSCYADDFSDLPALGLVREARIYTASDKSTYWNLKWIRFKETTDLAVDIETAALVGATVNADFSGLEAVGDVPAAALGRLVHDDSSGGDTAVWRT